MNAERDALVDLIRANEGLCACGHDATGEHNSLGCYARLSYEPLISCDCKRDHGDETTAQHLADAILAAGWTRTTKGSGTDEACHCGKPVAYGYDGDPTHHRGMCENCDSVRCDAYPGACTDHALAAVGLLVGRTEAEIKAEALREAAEAFATGEWVDAWVDVDDDISAVRATEIWLLERADSLTPSVSGRVTAP